ncbi:hypothetical protein ACNOYE_23540 [Nannocystaceae bacterium ST9]
MHVRIASLFSTKPLLLLAGLATLPFALIGHASPAIDAGPSMASSTDPLEDRLAAIADYYGDASGHIDLHITGTSQTLYVATGAIGSAFSLYTNGQSVTEGSDLAACSLNLAGGVAICDPAYDETLLFALEDLQAAEPDPSELTLECHQLSGSKEKTTACMVTLISGTSWCYLCSGGTCTSTDC